MVIGGLCESTGIFWMTTQLLLTLYRHLHPSSCQCLHFKSAPFILKAYGPGGKLLYLPVSAKPRVCQ